MKQIFVGLCAGMVAVSAVAQEATSVWSRSVSAGLTVRDGNSNSEAVQFTAEAERRTDRFETDVLLDWNYGESEDVKDTENGRLALEQRLVSEGDHYVKGLVDASYDEFKDIDYRVMAGPAVGTFLIRTEMIRLSAELGPVYIFEKINDLKEDYLSVRVAQEFSYAFEQFGKLTQMVEYIARADDDENYQINAEVGLESALSERLALGVTLRSRYDNSVGGDTEKNDVTLVSSLKLQL